MFPPIFPIYIPALAPLYPYAPLVWLTGVACLGLTRYTHQLGRAWRAGYYLFSALVRPAGVALLAAGWLALYAPVRSAGRMLFGQPVGWLPRGNWLDGVWWACIGLSLGLDVWAILALGLRRSFLFRRVDDRLVTSGPYALVRHPQFLATIALTFFGMRLFDPAAVRPDGIYFYETLNANWVLLVLALWLLSILEERELSDHFGGEYEAYAQRVPRLVPGLRRLGALLGNFPPLQGARQRAGRLAKAAHTRWGSAFLVLLRLAELGLLAVACGTVVVAAHETLLRGAGGGLLSSCRRWTDILCWLGTAAFLAFGAWALASDPRRWLPWRGQSALPALRGPYALVRHPALLAAVGVTLLTTRPFDPLPIQVFVLGRAYAFGSHWLPYTAALWLLAVVEDGLLATRLGPAYEAFAREVPRLFPN